MAYNDKNKLKEHNKRYYQEHKDRIKMMSKKWAKKNRKKINISKRKRYRESIEEQRERQRKYYKKNSGKEKERRKRYYNKNPKKARDVRRRCMLKRNYGMTINDYEVMFKKQGYRCAICGNTKTGGHKGFNDINNFCIDHDHKTGKVRGLLCDNCNVGLGRFGDDKEILKKAIIYLGN